VGSALDLGKTGAAEFTNLCWLSAEARHFLTTRSRWQNQFRWPFANGGAARLTSPIGHRYRSKYFDLALVSQVPCTWLNDVFVEYFDEAIAFA
jgi:hypothetical protein